MAPGVGNYLGAVFFTWRMIPEPRKTSKFLDPERYTHIAWQTVETIGATEKVRLLWV
jgi:hypothetical protein